MLASTQTKQEQGSYHLTLINAYGTPDHLSENAAFPTYLTHPYIQLTIQSALLHPRSGLAPRNNIWLMQELLFQVV
jgi:hypothetical protein